METERHFEPGGPQISIHAWGFDLLQRPIFASLNRNYSARTGHSYLNRQGFPGEPATLDTEVSDPPSEDGLKLI
jgi:hypothetical protein